MSTCNWLELESLGSWPTMPKNFLGTGWHHLSLALSWEYLKFGNWSTMVISGSDYRETISMEDFGHSRSRSWCFQYKLVKCWHLSGFLKIKLRNILEIPLNRLVIFLKSWIWTNYFSNSTSSSVNTSSCWFFPYANWSKCHKKLWGNNFAFEWNFITMLSYYTYWVPYKIVPIITPTRGTLLDHYAMHCRI